MNCLMWFKIKPGEQGGWRGGSQLFLMQQHWYENYPTLCRLSATSWPHSNGFCCCCCCYLWFLTNGYFGIIFLFFLIWGFQRILNFEIVSSQCLSRHQKLCSGTNQPQSPLNFWLEKWGNGDTRWPYVEKRALNVYWYEWKGRKYHLDFVFLLCFLWASILNI